MSDQLTSKVRRARKRRICDDCRLVIPAGDEYHYSTVAGDGTVWSWSEHVECYEIAQQALVSRNMDADDWWGADTFRDELLTAGVDTSDWRLP